MNRASLTGRASAASWEPSHEQGASRRAGGRIELHHINERQLCVAQLARLPITRLARFAPGTDDAELVPHVMWEMRYRLEDG